MGRCGATHVQPKRRVATAVCAAGMVQQPCCNARICCFPAPLSRNRLRRRIPGSASPAPTRAPDPALAPPLSPPPHRPPRCPRPALAPPSPSHLRVPDGLDVAAPSRNFWAVLRSVSVFRPLPCIHVEHCAHVEPPGLPPPPCSIALFYPPLSPHSCLLAPTVRPHLALLHLPLPFPTTALQIRRSSSLQIQILHRTPRFLC